MSRIVYQEKGINHIEFFGKHSKICYNICMYISYMYISKGIFVWGIGVAVLILHMCVYKMRCISINEISYSLHAITIRSNTFEKKFVHFKIGAIDFFCNWREVALDLYAQYSIIADSLTCVPNLITCSNIRGQKVYRKGWFQSHR